MDFFRLFCILLIAAGLGLSCSDSGEDGSADALPPGYSDGGEVMLEETLVIGESTGVILGSVGGVVANGEGTIFVADPENAHIRVFSPAGDSLTTIGRKGQGPGEFQNVYELYMTEDDSLIVHDRRSRQLSVFSPEPPFSFTRRFAVPRRNGGFPTQILMPDTTGYLVVYYNPLGDREDGRMAPDRWVSWLDPSGEVIEDSLFTVEGKPGILSSESDFRMFLTVPFGKGPQFARGPASTVFYGRTDSLRVAQRSLEGTVLKTVRLPYTPIAVTREDADSVRAARNERARKLLAQVDFPEYRPAFRELITDDQDRVWIDVIDQPSSDSTTWKIVDLSAQEVVDTQLPEKVSIRYIRDGRVCGVREDENGLDEVVVYEIRNV